LPLLQHAQLLVNECIKTVLLLLIWLALATLLSAASWLG
jgi:hypothetical protein